MLDVGAFAPLRLADVLAQRPQRARLARRLRERSRRRATPASIACGERGLDDARRAARRRRCRPPARARTTDGRAASSAEPGWCLRDSASENALMSSKPTRRSDERALAAARGARSRRSTDATRDERGDLRARRRKELHHGRGDDAERAFGADEELLQVVARVVLAQAAQRREHAAVGEHGLDAQRRARACCRSAAPRCRRRWSTGCRRSCSCLPTRATAGSAAPPRPRRPAPRRAARRLRR